MSTARARREVAPQELRDHPLDHLLIVAEDEAHRGSRADATVVRHADAAQGRDNEGADGGRWQRW